MKPIFQARPVNDPFGDPGVYVEFLFERRALLFDIGENTPLTNRHLLRISDIFISHTHMDHFMGLDRLVRVLLGRDRTVRLYGPPGLVEQVGHKLAAYTWNLVQEYPTDFTLCVTEVDAAGAGRYAEYHCRDGFRRRAEREVHCVDGVLWDEEQLRVRYAVLDHKIPSLGFVLEEKQHVNVWKSRLDELGLPVGPWLGELKQGVLRGAPEETPITVTREGPDGSREERFTLGALREQVLTFTPGQRIAYVVDTGAAAPTRGRILDLIQGADWLFMETTFLDADRHLAAEKRHLTARQAGEMAREAGVKRLIPLHYSVRYEHTPDALEAEARAAFEGRL